LDLHIIKAIDAAPTEKTRRDLMNIPFLLDTDSYKTGHSLMYPDAEEMTAYFTCRGPLVPEDHRIVFYGMRYMFDEVLSRQITWEDIHEMDEYLETHGVAKTQFYYPRDLWVSVVEDEDGFLPFKIRALRDGTTVYPQVPCFTITAKGKYARLVTWFETQLMRIWSPTVTATKSRLVWDTLREAFDRSVDEEFDFLLASRLHDFGSRGVSSAETAMVTGSAHLLSFEGTDNMIAGWLATKYNDGEPVGESVLASEHSVMTAWDDELEAVLHLVSVAPENSILSVVADSYDYDNFIWNFLPQVAPLAQEKNLLFVIRPDSGEPIQCVLDGLEACEAAFGATVNSKGFKVLNGAAVIQGDGLDLRMIQAITRAVLAHGFSMQNVALGMGGGLLQKQDRDTLKVAIKLCQIRYSDGRVRDVMKTPTGDSSKISLPGNFQVNTVDGVPTVYPLPGHWEDFNHGIDALKTIWDCGPTKFEFETFQQMRDRLNRSWKKAPRKTEVLSNQMLDKIEKVSGTTKNIASETTRA
jgi:nicotinamide phosphoribosyltransferase